MLNPPGEAGVELSNWNWKVVRQFLKQSFDLGLSRSSCLNYLHRLGFVLKRPKKRLLKAKDEERKAFIANTPVKQHECSSYASWHRRKARGYQTAGSALVVRCEG